MDNYGVIVNESQENDLKEHFNQSKPKDASKFLEIPVAKALSLLAEVKTEEKVEVKKVVKKKVTKKAVKKEA